MLPDSLDQSGIRRYFDCERYINRGSRVIHLVGIEDHVQHLQEEQRERARDQDYASGR